MMDTRDDLTKNEVIALAMSSFKWKEAKCLSWYKLQNVHLGGNSPMELVQRGQTGLIVEFLRRKRDEMERFEKRD
ncbi:MAG: hypothetical protein JST80_02335 [Bdellovibrionales bacterium]|nr:hypothetical protein [Bdellovibrionales bacterium]